MVEDLAQEGCEAGILPENPGLRIGEETPALDLPLDQEVRYITVEMEAYCHRCHHVDAKGLSVIWQDLQGIDLFVTRVVTNLPCTEAPVKAQLVAIPLALVAYPMGIQLEGIYPWICSYHHCHLFPGQQSCQCTLVLGD